MPCKNPKSYRGYHYSDSRNFPQRNNLSGSGHCADRAVAGLWIIQPTVTGNSRQQKNFQIVLLHTGYPYERGPRLSEDIRNQSRHAV